MKLTLLKMEGDKVERLSYEEQIEMKLRQLWHYITKSYSKNLLPIDDYVEELLNLEDANAVKEMRNSMNKFCYLPTNFAKLTYLVQLDLSNNSLKNLPHCLCLLNNLQYLILNNNQLSFLPSFIGDLKELKSLKVQKNWLEEVPESMKNLSNLQDLDLSFNKLKNIPSACKILNKLKYFSLAKNNLSNIPDCISTGMSYLETLDLSQNKLIILDIPLCSTNIRKFHARENDVCPTFPKWILTSKYYKLEEVSLDHTVFKKVEFPSETSLVNIKILSMIECNMSEAILSEIMRRLKHPESISVGNNKKTSKSNSFRYLPIQDIKEKSSLKDINAQKADIPMIPKYINDFVNLVTIDISFNNITWLPDELCYLKNLRILIINNNSLMLLPDSIDRLESLEELKVNNNALTRMPHSITYLNNLKFLDLYNNEFISVDEVDNINITRLQGLDLEQNYFSTSDLPITKSYYENLRSALLEHWNERSRGPIGSKVEHLSDEDRMPYRSNYTSDSSDSELCELSNPLELLEENWDDSENSDDEFDPNVIKKPKSRQCFPLFAHTMSQLEFCPSDLHAQPIANRVLRMLNNGTLFWKIEFEEGQFEDV